MGCCCSITKKKESLRDDGQYASLVVTKPPPITLEEIQSVNDDKMDVPLFAEVDSDAESLVGSNPNSLSDVEINLYIKNNLTGSETDDNDNSN